MLLRVDLALLPAEGEAIDAEAFVVIDVLRATTTIAAFLAAGASRITAVDALDLGRERASTAGALLAGEVGGLPPKGFDFGNSPRDAAAAALTGREVVLFTTNGTRALCRLAARGPVYAGAVVNAGAVARAVVRGHRSAVLVCAGDAAGTRFGLDDFAAAGAIIAAIVAVAPASELGDAARLAISLWDERGPAALRGSHHAGALRALGLGADIDFALEQDRFSCVPAVVAHGAGWVAIEDRAATP